MNISFPHSDINECLDIDVRNGCEGDCINTEGSYDCQCINGKVWSFDNHSCEGILYYYCPMELSISLK